MDETLGDPLNLETAVGRALGVAAGFTHQVSGRDAKKSNLIGGLRRPSSGQLPLLGSSLPLVPGPVTDLRQILAMLGNVVLVLAQAVLASLIRLIGWRSAKHHFDPIAVAWAGLDISSDSSSPSCGLSA